MTTDKKAKNGSLEATLAAARDAKRLKGASGRLSPLERAERNPASLRLAINAHCYECQGGGGDPGVVQRIRECASARCTLHAVRPYQRREPEAAE